MLTTPSSRGWYQGWSGLKNGALLSAAEADGYELFITADQELTYQQNMSGRRIALVVLSTNHWRLVKAHIAEITAAINEASPEASFLSISDTPRDNAGCVPLVTGIAVTNE